MLEKLLLAHYIKAFGKGRGSLGYAREAAFKKMLLLKDRMPVHSGIDRKGNWIRKMYWAKMGLLTHHEPLEKKKILRDKKNYGRNTVKLLNSDDLSYFNNGVRRIEYNCN